MNTFTLLQLADAAWPTGGFAFSQGLESQARIGLISDEKTFVEYLESYLGQIASYDLPFLNSGFELVLDSSPDFLMLAEEWEAGMTTAPMKKASLTQGKAWLRLIDSVHPQLSSKLFCESLKVTQVEEHFLLVFIWSLKSLGCSLSDGQTLLFHMALRDQLSAAIRLGLIGPLQAQSFQSRFHAICDHYIQRYGNIKYTSACKTAPLIEIGQGYSPQLYSRLFQN